MGRKQIKVPENGNNSERMREKMPTSLRSMCYVSYVNQFLQTRRTTKKKKKNNLMTQLPEEADTGQAQVWERIENAFCIFTLYSWVSIGNSSESTVFQSL